jgi:hypothetical protein
MFHHPLYARGAKPASPPFTIMLAFRTPGPVAAFMPRQTAILQRLIPTLCLVLLLSASLAAQSKRLWILRPPGEMAEFDPATFAPKQTVKVPVGAASSPQNMSVNHLGQMLFAAPVTLPLAEDELAADRKVWFWDGHSAATLARDVARTTATAGSNLAITESAPVPYLSADGTQLYWFSNRARRLQRDGVDLSTETTWLSWQTDLTGAGRQEAVSVALPDCSCPTGGCEETCPYGEVWVPDDGVGKFFLLTQFVAGQTQPLYEATSLYQENSGKWTATPIDPPLRGMLDAANASTLLEAIPDAGCCGWENQSDDRTLLHLRGKTVTVFDEQATYKNPDYTAEPNTPIQLADQGQANPDELQHIRKSLLDLPAVEIKSNEDVPRRIAFLPHATLVGWISDKEILIVEGHLLVAYNVASGTRRKSNIPAEDAAHVFLR